MCVHVCVPAYVYVFVCVCMRVHMRVSVCMCVCARAYAQVYVCVRVSFYACIMFYLSLCERVCVPAWESLCHITTDGSQDTSRATRVRLYIGLVTGQVYLTRASPTNVYYMTIWRWNTPLFISQTVVWLTPTYRASQIYSRGRVLYEYCWTFWRASQMRVKYESNMSIVGRFEGRVKCILMGLVKYISLNRGEYAKFCLADYSIWGGYD